jgi:hydrogenase maturation protease
LLVDAAHLAKDPGTVVLLDAAQISGVSFSTHMLPAPILLDYLAKSAGCRALVLGIQPSQTDVLGPISKPVAKAIDAIVATVREAFSG